MSWDHYVSPVHLKRFLSPGLKDGLYALRKSDLSLTTPRPREVCRVEENGLLPDAPVGSAIEAVLSGIESNYNRSVNKLLANQLDEECIRTLAGFAACVTVGSPAGRRIQAEALRLQFERGTMDVAVPGGACEPASPLGQGFNPALRENQALPFGQASGIAALIAEFGNADWDILINDFDDRPFFTSDYPVAVEATPDPRVLNRVVPLAPKLAVRIRPRVPEDRSDTDLSFSAFGSRTWRLSRDEVVKVNRMVVRCAEDLVFFRDHKQWVTKFVERNRGFRVEIRPKQVRLEDGLHLLDLMQVVSTRP